MLFSESETVEYQCLECQKRFIPKRSDAKFCSNSCKARYWAKFKQGQQQSKIEPRKPEPVPVLQIGTGPLDSTSKEDSDLDFDLPPQTIIQKNQIPNPEDQNLQALIQAKEKTWRGYFNQISKLNTDIIELQNWNPDAPVFQGTALASVLMGMGLIAVNDMVSDKKNKSQAVENTKVVAGIILVFAAGYTAYNKLKLKPEQRRYLESQKQNGIFSLKRQLWKLKEKASALSNQTELDKEKLKLIPEFVDQEEVIPNPDYTVALSSVERKREIAKQVAGYRRYMERVRNAEPGDDPSRPVSFGVEDLLNNEFQSLPFQGEWEYFLGEPAANFCAVIFGTPGSGKSTYAMKLAKYLADNFGEVAYVTSEEGFTKTMQNKIRAANFTAETKVRFFELHSTEEVLKQILPGDFAFVILDSLDHMSIGAEAFRFLHGQYCKQGALIAISQSTKDGNMRGSQAIAHQGDIVIKLMAGGDAVTEKNRFQETGRKINVHKSRID